MKKGTGLADPLETPEGVVQRKSRFRGERPKPWMGYARIGRESQQSWR